MGCPVSLAGRNGAAVLAALALGCAGAGGADPDCAAVVISEIQPQERINRPPRFLSLAPRMAREGRPYRYGVAAMDPDGDEVHLTLLRAPEGAALEGGILTWTPEPGQAGRPQRFTLRAADEHGGAREQTWTVIPKPERPLLRRGTGHRH